jgi:hypothetical protein
VAATVAVVRVAVRAPADAQVVVATAPDAGAPRSR